MQTPTVPDHLRERPDFSGNRPDVAESKFEGQPRPISEFAGRSDFPECLRGVYVDIGGYAGVVTEITRQSIRVKSPENITQSFNVNVLRRLYSPRPEPAIGPPGAASPAPAPADAAPTGAQEPAVTPPKKQVVAEPDFNKPARPISHFASRLDFPRNALGEHVDIAGFQGVVIELAADAVKVKSSQGIIRSYGVKTLRSLYGRR